MKQRKKVACFYKYVFIFLHHVNVCVCRVLRKKAAPECTMERQQADGGSGMLWAMFCWEMWVLSFMWCHCCVEEHKVPHKKWVTDTHTSIQTAHIKLHSYKVQVDKLCRNTWATFCNCKPIVYIVGVSDKVEAEYGYFVWIVSFSHIGTIQKS